MKDNLTLNVENKSQSWWEKKIKKETREKWEEGREERLCERN